MSESIYFTHFEITEPDIYNPLEMAAERGAPMVVLENKWGCKIYSLDEDYSYSFNRYLDGGFQVGWRKKDDV